MKEYIVSIAENIGDEYVRGIGAIRKNSQQLIRCKDCKHYADDACDRYADETLGYVHSTQADGFCWVAERKEE